MNFESLIQTLETEVGIYKDFKEIEEGKTAIIIEGDVEKLNDVLNNEHMLHMKLQSIEKKRIETMRNLGIGGKKLAEIIELAQGTEKEKLSGILKDLNGYIDALKQINDYNTKLIKSRLEIISSVTKLLKDPNQEPVDPKNVQSKRINNTDRVYGKNAKVFDQSVDFEDSVINKKV